METITTIQERKIILWQDCACSKKSCKNGMVELEDGTVIVKCMVKEDGNR